MSRFSGWNANTVAKLSGKITNTNEQADYAKKNAKKICKLYPDYVGQIKKAIETELGLRCEREYKFLHDRRFRFDLAIPDERVKIAIEFEGGVWTHGRHTRGKGYINDTKKYNLAMMHGWKLLRYTVEDTKKDNYELLIIKEIRKLINPSEDG